ncbi:TetR family transcriptional regulator [Serratia marcescens]|uniref:TetR family transcriptional regulator n=1 Tax=Serratia marcescens TaxID=615 RepID=A0A1Q4P457_SERMA|nr:TetR/AcrR family transcriptional regulator [Serratia marcescens]OKB67904.1 TetR family transcriptional regulator [Serratia marcescens]
MGNREKIVDAALHSFTHKGFHQTSMRDIAQAAGVSVGNLYNHFAGKEALIGEIALLENGVFAEFAAGLRAAGGRPKQALSAFFSAYHAFVAEPANVQLSAEIVAEVARNPALAAQFSANQRQLLEALAAVIADAQQTGEIAAAIAPLQLAQLMLDVIESQAWRQAIFASRSPEDTTPVQLLEQLLYRHQ